MSEYDYQSVMQKVRAMDEWKIDALNAVCCDKLMPIMCFLAMPNTTRCSEDCLEFVLRAARGHDVDTSEGQQIIREIESAPEWNTDYPDSLAFTVGRCLNVFHFALQGVVAESKVAKLDCIAFGLVLETVELIDLANEQNAAIRNVTERIEECEEKAQLTLVANLLEQEQPSNEFLNSIIHNGGNVKKQVLSSLPTFCYHTVSCLIQSASINSEQG